MPNTGPATACPDPKEYRQLASGELPESSREALLLHLEGCDSCAQSLKSLPESDTLVDLLRREETLSDPASREIVAQLVERLSRLRPPRTSASAGTNQAPTPHAPAMTGEAAATGAHAFEFLGPAQQPGEIGRLGGYRVLDVLGAGGMGVVFRAEDPQLARMVALKAMLPGYLADEGARQRFVREARAAAAIKHDHIVSIYQVSEDRGVLFLAMELLEGESLDARLQRERKLPAAEVVRIGRQIAQALAAAHKRGLIHRDIKPANIWIEAESARVKILDFGLARGSSEATQITQLGMIVGTPAYMAPEQGMGQNLDHRCDLFSLGCVLYQMATGEAPFRGSDVVSTLFALATETPRPPRELEPSVPRALSDLIVNLLAKEAANRPTSAQVVVEKLDEIAHELSRAAPVKPPKRWPVLTAAAACLVAIAAGVVFFMQTPDGIARIEIDDAQIKVAVEGHIATITKADTQPITLQPGKHGLTITRGNFSFNTASFELPGRGRTALKITWHPEQKLVVMQDGIVIGEKWAVAADPDRRAAEWALAKDGSVRVVVQEQRLDIKAGGKLPAEAFGVESISLSNTTVTSADVHLLHKLSSLRELYFDNVPLGDAGLREVTGLSHLERLRLYHAELTDTGLGQLKGLTGLKFLGLFNNPAVTDAGLVHLNEMTNLDELDLNGTRVTDQGFAHLRGLKKLESLNIMGTPVHGDGLALLDEPRPLRMLLAAGSEADDRLITALQGFPNLEVLGLDNTHVSDDGLKFLPGLKKLTFLALTGTKVSDAAVDHLVRMKDLKELRVDSTRISKDGITRLKQALPNAVVISSTVAHAPADPNRPLPTPDFAGEPHVSKPGDSVRGVALVQTAADLPGVRGWTIEHGPIGVSAGLSRVRMESSLSPCAAMAHSGSTMWADVPRRILVGHNCLFIEAAWSLDGKYLALSRIWL